MPSNPGVLCTDGLRIRTVCVVVLFRRPSLTVSVTVYVPGFL
jgi:hypothetical protein